MKYIQIEQRKSQFYFIHIDLGYKGYFIVGTTSRYYYLNAARKMNFLLIRRNLKRIYLLVEVSISVCAEFCLYIFYIGIFVFSRGIACWVAELNAAV